MKEGNIAIIKQDYVLREKNPMIVEVFVLEGVFRTGQSVSYEGQIGILKLIEIDNKISENVSTQATAALSIEGVEYKRDRYFIYGKV